LPFTLKGAIQRRANARATKIGLV